MIPPVRVEIRPSRKVEGEIGLFAVRKLKKDSVIADAAHFSNLKFMSWADIDRLDKITRKKVIGYCPGTEKGVMVPPDINYLSVVWQMNHSCNPNVGFNDKDDFVAMRDIRSGEELTWDYSYDETNPKFRMKCSCGEKKCRKIVTGRDWVNIMGSGKAQYFSTNLKKFIKQSKTI